MNPFRPLWQLVLFACLPSLVVVAILLGLEALR